MRINARVIASFLSALMVAGGCTRVARAECVPAKKAMAPQKVTPNDKNLALGRYKAGNELLKKNDYEGALVLFLQSRALWPNRSNTKNAAICLYELGRYPEALALYEELLERFGMDLEEEERNLVATIVAELEKKVLIADVTEPKGTFSIDDEACGALPRKEPVYLMPGSHILHVLRPGEPESLAGFSGEGGERISIAIPKPPTFALPPELGRWFVQGSVGPAFGWSGIDTLRVGELEQSVGIVAQAHGGYWLSNGTTIGLTTGLLYLYSSAEVKHGSGNFEYSGTHATPLFAPFVGISAGWVTEIRKRFDLSFRGTLGLMSTQSKNEVDVELSKLDSIGTVGKIPVDISGRNIVRSVPSYASVEVGGAVRLGNWRVGITIGGLFLFDDGPILPDAYLTPRGGASDGFDGGCGVTPAPDDPDCLSAVRVLGKPTHRPSFVLLPQVVVGF